MRDNIFQQSHDLMEHIVKQILNFDDFDKLPIKKKT